MYIIGVETSSLVAGETVDGAVVDRCICLVDDFALDLYFVIEVPSTVISSTSMSSTPTC